jgi:hypothetical protein
VKVKALVFQARSSLAESRRASEIPCHEIREQLATLRGGALRRGPLRRHLRACAGCSEFRSEVARQRTMLALALPVLPTAGLKQGVLAAAGLTPGAAGGAVAGGALTGGAATSGAATAGGATAGGASLCGVGSVTGGGALSSLGAAGAAKVALVAAVAATGGVAIDQATSTSAERHGSPAAAHQGAARHRGSHAPPGAVVVPGDRGLQSPGGHGEKKGQAAGGAAAAQHGKAHKGHEKAADGSHGRAGAPGRAHGSHGSGNRVEEPVGGTGAQSSAPGGGTQSPAPGIGRQGGSHGPPATKPPHPDHPSTGRGNSGGAANGHHLGG